MFAKGDIVVDVEDEGVYTVDECIGGMDGITWVQDIQRDDSEHYTSYLELASPEQAAKFKADWNARIQREIKELLDLCFTPTSSSTHEQIDS